MLVKLLSDLHLHGNDPFKYVDHGEYVCVLAGDISEGMNGVYWAVKNIPPHIKVIYVPGNHEYYGQDYFFLKQKFAEYNNYNTHVHIYDNESVVIGDVEFVCSTLWTDFDVYNNQPLHSIAWKHGLNDSMWIKYRGSSIIPQNFINWNKDSLKYMKYMSEQVRSDEVVRVLVTHYCPEFSVAPNYRGDQLTPGFATKIPIEIHEAFDFHFHGHTHSSMNYETPYGVKVRCNPRGYAFEGGEFNEELVLDI